MAVRALAVARQRVERGVEARVLFLLRAIDVEGTREGDRAGAEVHYTAAMARAKSSGCVRSSRTVISA
jgi:hypothetical protein